VFDLSGEVNEFESTVLSGEAEPSANFAEYFTLNSAESGKRLAR